jgi:hypothetical protein
VDLRVLQKISLLNPQTKICIGNKLIVLAVNFTGARRSGCARDRIKKVRGLTNPFDECGLTRARWSRNHKENSVAAEFHQVVILSEAKNLRLLLSPHPPNQ